MAVAFKTLDELRVELVAYTETAVRDDEEWQHSDSDFLPVTAARVSHGNDGQTGQDREKDIRLMKYLAKHKHFSPFEHQSATFLIEAPLFIAREWMRHRTQSFNEISMRYTSDPADTYWIPDEFRAQAIKNKQSSAGVVTEFITGFETPEQLAAYEAVYGPVPPTSPFTLYRAACEYSVMQYNDLLKGGVCREQARAVLPVGMVTRFYATANLRNWAHWYKLRSDEGAQKEIQHYATKIDTILTNMWPNAWGVLKENAA